MHSSTSVLHCPKMTHKLHFSSKLGISYTTRKTSNFSIYQKINGQFFFSATRQSDGLQMEDTNSWQKSGQEVGCSLTSLISYILLQEKYSNKIEER